MVFFAFLSLINSFVALFCGIYIYSKNTKAKLNQTFAFFCFASFITIFCEFMFRQTDDFQTAFFWLRISSFTWPYILAAIVHFTLVFSAGNWLKKHRIQTYLILYTTVFAVSLLSFFLAGPPYRTRYVYTYASPSNIELFLIVVVWGLIAMVLSYFLLIHKFVRTRGKKRTQSALIIAGLSMPFLFGTSEFFSFAIDKELPNITTISFAWLAGFILYAMQRYQLFTISLEKAAAHILTVMPSALFLLDSTRNIVQANNRALEILGYNKDELIGRHINFIFIDGSTAEDKLYHLLRAKAAIQEHEDTLVGKNNLRIPVIISGKLLFDKTLKLSGTVLIAKDITKRKKMEESIRTNEQRFKALIDTTIAPVISIKSKDQVILFNPAAEKEFGYRSDEILGKDLTILMPERYRKQHKEAVARFLNKRTGKLTGKIHEVKALRKDGTEFPIELFVSAWNQNGEWYFTGITQNITARKHSEALTKFMAYHDSLTGLPNRRMFEDIAEKEIAKALREDGLLSVFYIDVDDFKLINDTYGHRTGDLLLIETAIRLREILRKEDTVARMGGDEFVAILNIKHESDSKVVADKLLSALTKPLKIDGSKIPSSVSMGISIFQKDGKNINELLVKADDALYDAKGEGKGLYRFYHRAPKGRAA